MKELIDGPDFGTTDPEQDIIDLGLAGNLAASLYATATSVSRSAQAGRVLLWEQPLERLLRGLHLDAVPIVQPIEELNYEVYQLSGDLERVMLSHPSMPPFAHFRPSIYLLGYPAPDKDESLHHIIFLHELGHILVSESRDLRRRLRNLGFTKAQYHTLASQDELEAESAAESLRDWVEELACDLFGLHIGGPAFAVAQCEFLGGLADDELTASTHPPEYLRLELLLSAASSSDSTINSRLDAWQQWLREQSQSSETQSDLRIRRIRDLFPRIVAIVDSATPRTIRFNPQADIPHLIDRMARGLPPDQYGLGQTAQPARLAEILNAGWAAAIESERDDLGRFRRLGGTFEARRSSISSLTGKAVELSEIAIQWQELATQ